MNANAAMPPRRGEIAFDRAAPGLTGIAVQGFLLSLVTFGIYRFWYMTNLRRFFWSRTLVDGSPGEYTGTGKELFLGFLVALAVLVPIYIGLFAVSLIVPRLAPFSAIISFAALFLLGQFAIYRGRRYRASRTLWRGIRLGQDGSGLVYAAMAAGWSLLTILTLGLAFPFARASLERYRVRHTLVGAHRMASLATGRSILLPWLAFYAVALAPVAVVAGLLLFANGFHLPTDLWMAKPGRADQLTLNPAYAGTAVYNLAIALGVTAAVCVPLAFLLVPFYRAREARAFMNAASLGPVRLVSTLRARQFYWPYILYFLSVTGFVVLASVLVGIVVAAAAAGGGKGEFSPVHLVLLVGMVVLYIGGALLFAVLYVRIVQARLWAAVASSTAVTDANALNTILAGSRGPGSGLNEGLADALDVGGALQIGF